MSGKEAVDIAGGRRQEEMEGVLGAQGGVVHRYGERGGGPADTCLSQSSREAGEDPGRSRQGRKREARAREEGVETADSGVGRAARPGAPPGSGQTGALAISLRSRVENHRTSQHTRKQMPVGLNA